MSRFGYCLTLTAGFLAPLAWGGEVDAQTAAQIMAQLLGAPQALPHVPPDGAWGEIINVTDRWIVIQNQAGQQFPLAVEDIGQFLMRWPTSLEALTIQSLVEAYGLDLGSNTIETAHVDVYEGDDRSLVTPMYNRSTPNNANLPTIHPVVAQLYNSLMTTWGYPGMLTLWGWTYPAAPNGLGGVPIRTHIVGAAIERFPLRVALPGNNAATIVAGRNNEFTISQVTRGSTRLVSKGDYAFLAPAGVKLTGIVVQQLVVYKKVTLHEFRARR